MGCEPCRRYVLMHWRDTRAAGAAVDAPLGKRRHEPLLDVIAALVERLLALLNHLPLALGVQLGHVEARDARCESDHGRDERESRDLPATWHRGAGLVRGMGHVASGSRAGEGHGPRGIGEQGW
jgi:hypothetical protein